MFHFNLLHPTPPGHTWVHVELALDAEVFEPEHVRRLRHAVHEFLGLDADAVSLLEIWRWRPVVGLALPVDEAFDLVRAAKKPDAKWRQAFQEVSVRSVSLDVDGARQYSVGGDPLDMWQNMDVKLEAFYAKLTLQEGARLLGIERSRPAPRPVPRESSSGSRLAAVLSESLAAAKKISSAPKQSLSTTKGTREPPNSAATKVRPAQPSPVMDAAPLLRRASDLVESVRVPESWRARFEDGARLVEMSTLVPRRGMDPIREDVWTEKIQERARRFQWRMNIQDFPHLLKAKSTLLFLRLTAWNAWLGGVVGTLIGLVLALKDGSGIVEQAKTVRSTASLLPVDEEHKPLASSVLIVLGVTWLFFTVIA